MLTDHQARAALIDLIKKYLKGKDPEYENLIEITGNLLRQVPIRAVLEHIRKFSPIQFQRLELAIVDELLYAYG